MTLANKITLARVAAIPVFVACVLLYSSEAPAYRYAALGIFALAMISDAVDGLAARWLNQRTRLGMALDPLADKLLLNVAYVFLAVNVAFETPVPKWMPPVILARDVVVVLGAYLIHEYYGSVKAAPHILGKVNTACQMAGIAAVLLELPPPYVMGVLYAVAATTLLSLADYVQDGIRQVKGRERIK